MRRLADALLSKFRLPRAFSASPNSLGGQGRTGPGDVPVDLLAPSVLGKIGGLDLIARSVVDGVMSGKHRSTHKGGCSEFAEHRLYAQGDDIRLIDWRLYARSDRHYVKQFEDETNLNAWVVVDASGSMGFGMSTISKFDYARMAAACLARLLLRQRDSIGLMIDTCGQRHVIAPRPRATHFHALAQVLAQSRAAGSTTLNDMLFDLTGILRRRSMVLVFSDCLDDVDRLTKVLQQLRLRGHDVVVFQVFAPEERTFDFQNVAVFEDLEGTGLKINVDPGAIRRRYLERVDAFLSELQTKITRIDCDLVTMTTHCDLGDTLAHYLHRRAASRVQGGGR